MTPVRIGAGEIVHGEVRDPRISLQENASETDVLSGKGPAVLTRNSSEFDVGARLASLRAGRGQSQGTTARLADLSAAYLSRIETGRVHPTFATVIRVLDALHADLGELHALEGPRPRGHPACPVTDQGHCLLGIVRGAAEVVRADGREAYSPREIRILRDLAAFMRTATPQRLRVIEMLLQELIGRPAAAP